MRRLSYLHPLLFATYGSLALLASNLGQIEVSAALRSLAISIGISLLLVGLLFLLLRNFGKGALISSGAILLIFSYGHVGRLVDSLLPALSGSLFVPLLWGVALAAWVYLILRMRSEPIRLGQYFLIVGLLMNALPAFTLLTYARATPQTEARLQEYREGASQADGAFLLDDRAASAAYPDIYYLVLDAYTREDVLRELYGYDNSPFLDSLRQRGFYVADASRANYPRTEPSIASSLNMMHLADLPEFLRSHDLDASEQAFTRAATVLIKNNRVTETLRARGYTIVSFDSGYAAAYLAEPDILRQSPSIKEEGLWQAGFEVMLLDTTVGRELTRRLGNAYNPMQRLFDAHRERVLFTLEHLSDYAEQEGPYFIYAHMISPHVPYVFGPNGEAIRSSDPYTLLNARPGDEQNVRHYRDQLHYLNGLVLAAIDRVLAESERPPIILIQGDHSSKVYSVAEPSGVLERQLEFPILNAYYLPEGPTGLHDDITPVNSFRLVFDQYLGSSLGLVADSSYSLEAGPDGVRLSEVCTEHAPCQ